MATPNRIVLVHEGRRIFDKTGVCVEIVEQDDGDTMKVFVSDLPESEKSTATARHQQRFVRSLREMRRAR